MRALQQAGGEGLNLQHKAGNQRFSFPCVFFFFSSRTIFFVHMQGPRCPSSQVTVRAEVLDGHRQE